MDNTNKAVSKEFLKQYFTQNNIGEEFGSKVIADLESRGYTITGITEPNKTGFLGNAGGAIKNVFTERASNIGAGISEIGEAYNAETKQGGSIGAGLAGASVKALQQPLNIAGQAMGGVWDLATQAVMSIVPEDIKEKGQEFITNFIENSELAQKTLSEISEIQEKYPDVARALGNALNILPAPPAGKLATAGVKGTGKLTTKAIGGLDDLIKSASELTETAGKSLTRKISPTTEIAVENTYKGLLKQIENKKSIMSDFVKREGTGKDPLRVISENPDYMVRIDTASKSFDVKDAVSNLNRDVAQYSRVRDAVLSTADDTFGNIATDDVLKNVFTRISGKNYKTYLDEGERAVKNIITKMESLKKFNPETISRIELNNVRKGIDDTINTLTNTKLQDKLRLDMRTSFKEILEQSLPDNTLLKELNGKIGDLIDTSDFLTKKLAGSKVKGGGLTDLAIKTAGSQTGAIIGAGAGGVLGGIPGAFAGYGISEFLSKSLIKNAINNPFDRKVLEKMLQETPDIIKKSQEFINKMKSQTVKSTDFVKKKTNISRMQRLANAESEEVVDSILKPNKGIVKANLPESALMKEARKYKSAEEFIKAQGETLYHGTPYKFDTFKKGKTTYFTPKKSFAENYGSEKSFAREMDADIQILERFGKVNLFDGTKKADIEKLGKMLPDEVGVLGPMAGMGGKLSKKEVLERMRGIFTLDTPEFVFKAKKVGEIFEDMSIAHSGTYRIKKINKDSVVADKINQWGNVYGKDTDVYKTVTFKKDKTYQFKDAPYWKDFEGDTAIEESIKKLGYDGWVSSEKGVPTYAIFNPEKLKTKSQLEEIWNKAQK